MNKKEFYEKVTESVTESIEKISQKRKLLENLEDEKRSGKLSREYVMKTIDPEISGLKKAIEEMKVEGKKDIESLCEEYTGELIDEDSLHGEDLTDDAKLLNSGITLTKRDLESMLKRNSGNRTMTQVITRYAKEKDIDLGVYYVGNNETLALVKAVPYTTEIVLKWEGRNGMYEKLMGEGTDFEKAFLE